MLRFGLCCVFAAEPIRFRSTTATAAGRRKRPAHLARMQELALANAEALQQALEYCQAHAIGSFRVNSQILPLRTHPKVGWQVDDLPDGEQVRKAFRACGAYARKHDLRLTFHPDQFVVLNSPKPEVVASSMAELEYQAEVAGWIGADVIMIHGGGAYGDKPAALARLTESIGRLTRSVRAVLALENDDRIFSPRDLLPVCLETGVPLVYDVHHHRCLPDGLTEDDATREALATWRREPLFHISSPDGGWKAADIRRHAEFIAPADFPDRWRDLTLTVEVEARGKELAIQRLRAALAATSRPTVPGRDGRRRRRTRAARSGEPRS